MEKQIKIEEFCKKLSILNERIIDYSANYLPKYNHENIVKKFILKFDQYIKSNNELETQKKSIIEENSLLLMSINELETQKKSIIEENSLFVMKIITFPEQSNSKFKQISTGKHENHTSKGNNNI